MPTIADIIQQAAAQYGLPADYLMRSAQIESGMNPAAQNPNSSAGGLFQFIDPTWNQYGRGAPKSDATANTDAMARFTVDNRNRFRTTFGRDPSPGEMYLMHQQGAGGAINLLRNPGAPASSVVGDKAIALNAGQPGMTAGDFANLWTKKFGAGSQHAGSRAAPVPDAAGVTPGVAPPAPAAPTDGLGAMFAQLLSAQQPPAAEKPPESGKKPKRNDMASIFANVSPNLVLA
jgi:hypothetical protein